MSELRIVPSSQLLDAEWDELTALCIAAFDEPWDGYWESIGPGVHVIASGEGGRILAHAAVVDRTLYPGDLVVPAAYVEAVAVLPERQRGGLGTQVMREIDRMIDERYALGALGTGSQPFYQRLGWEVWRGPTWIRNRDGTLQRSADEDGGIMIRCTPSTPPALDLDAAIAVDWRPGEVW
ncbi:MAG TPA: GNAT family N-acetyltransferase [Candidatus Limnocylindria bacterium]|nr:GNAT family N-acetyltransferase [Candidatus Limnocylindria bacterium]